MRNQSLKSVAFFVGMLFVVLMSSCSNPTEKKIKLYEQQGKHLIPGGGPLYSETSYFYYYDDKGVYFVDVNLDKDILLIEFNKEYSPIQISIKYDKETKKICIQQKESEYIDDVLVFNANNSFWSFSDFGLRVCLPGKDDHIFCVGNPQRCYTINGSAQGPEDEKYLYFSYNGDFWECGVDGNDIDAPTHFKGLLSPGLLGYWVHNYSELPMEIFQYRVELGMSRAGEFCIVSDFDFFNINKTYTLNQISSGETMADLAEIMENVATEHFIAKAKRESVSFDKMLDTYKHNRTKADKEYHRGDKMVIYARIEKIVAVNDQYKYRLEYSDQNIDFKDRLLAYTNDDEFAELDYPCYLYFSGTYEGMSVEYNWFTSDERIFKFDDVIFLFN